MGSDVDSRERRQRRKRKRRKDEGREGEGVDGSGWKMGSYTEGDGRGRFGRCGAGRIEVRTLRRGAREEAWCFDAEGGYRLRTNW
jgi:hypothetical protein